MNRFRLMCIFVFLMGVIVFGASFVCLNDETVQPSPELTAQSGRPYVPKELGWSELDAERFTFSICGVFDPEDSAVDAWLYNPDTNDVLLVLRVYAGGEEIGETGFLKPGEYVQSVELTSEPEVGTDVQYQVVAYEPDTYYSAGRVELNTVVS